MKITILTTILIFTLGMSSCAHKPPEKKLQGHCDKVQSGDDLNACDPYPLK